MNGEELRKYKTNRNGHVSEIIGPRMGDGYDDMENLADHGWRALAGWGNAGWDLGNWPYVIIYTKETDGKYQLAQEVEGDWDTYVFDDKATRAAAITYLFIWYQVHGGYVEYFKDCDPEDMNTWPPDVHGPYLYLETVDGQSA